jgi:hypothetical protein
VPAFSARQFRDRTDESESAIALELHLPPGEFSNDFASPGRLLVWIDGCPLRGSRPYNQERHFEKTAYDWSVLLYGDRGGIDSSGGDADGDGRRQPAGGD